MLKANLSQLWVSESIARAAALCQKAFRTPNKLRREFVERSTVNQPQSHRRPKFIRRTKEKANPPQASLQLTHSKICSHESLWRDVFTLKFGCY